MFGKDPRVNPLDARKRLLIAASELNRAQLTQEWNALTAGLHSLTDRAKSIGSIASSAAVLVAGLAAFRSGRAADDNAKPSWTKRILKGAGLVSTLWLAFQSRSRDKGTSKTQATDR